MHPFFSGGIGSGGVPVGLETWILRNSLLGPEAQTFDLGPSQPLLPQKAPNSMFVHPRLGSRKARL